MHSNKPKQLIRDEKEVCVVTKKTLQSVAEFFYVKLLIDIT